MIAMTNYFQKIADPADIAPSAGITFSINHIAAIVLPVSFGFVWLINPSMVFLAGAGLAALSLLLSLLMPLNPKPGCEFIWRERKARATAPARSSG